MALTTTLTTPPLPPVPSSSVPITDPAWIDFLIKLQRYVAAQTAFMEPVAKAAADLQTGAGAAATAWQTASGTTTP